jgi:hypothetical protein
MKKLLFIMSAAALMASFAGCTKDDGEDDNSPSLYVIDFEDARVADYLAGPTAYGENLYSGYSGTNPDRYYGYDDIATGLYMMVNDPTGSGDPDFWNGGIAISRWNDMEAEGFANQCSVYYRDAATGNGGCNGSNTFAVATGYNDPVYMGDIRSSIAFRSSATAPARDCVFDHFYVANSTYAALAMKNGGYPATAFAAGDWFKLVIEGIDTHGTPTGAVEVYLADFRTPTAPGILTAWTKVDLSPLGRVTALKFDLQSSDNGDWGMNTPAYFCFDNLAIRQ